MFCRVYAQGVLFSEKKEDPSLFETFGSFLFVYNGVGGEVGLIYLCFWKHVGLEFSPSQKRWFLKRGGKLIHIDYVPTPPFLTPPPRK